MNKALVDKWVAALRSGEYKQGQDYLNSDGKYCCLGVLCEVAGVPKVPAPTEDGVSRYTYGGSAMILFKNVREALGIRSIDGSATIKVGDDGTYKSLANANDNGVSFAALADWIEQNWEKL